MVFIDRKSRAQRLCTMLAREQLCTNYIKIILIRINHLRILQNKMMRLEFGYR